ncbi:nucleoside phosphorylase domain-containing protein [Pseudomassariella vexata]|uniref:Nucleoside phosphorylase domain-containing protein n=1 Tax=Pseudomassariella vexata TaxID=1141098 RepID=A0A1Y2DB22_9PEZI|nr:nucleoside phosphorylase domain-containing protein [Pseudomassariella vexata]ORY56397.1 nucleoside phosphorylase domain-containing protein [Pseudomassariella vexata]
MSNPSQNIEPRLPLHEYTVGWISALPIEHAAAAEMLDEEHEAPARQDNDDTLYTLGRIQGHNVVIACLPAGLIGAASAASVAKGLTDRFPNVKLGLMVGIGHGVPSEEVDIRLGDVVVSQPRRGNGGVVQYDMGNRQSNGKFQDTSHLNTPSPLLLSALAQVQSNHIRRRSTFANHMSKFEGNEEFERGQAGPDQLFQPTYQHKRGPTCAECDKQALIKRDSRPSHKAVHFHYGTIASANTLMKDGVERDQTCQRLGGHVLCFEMEAAGLMNNFPCLVIRGICDYADSHKNERWQPYAAATAAAFAKEILSVIPAKDVVDLVPTKGTLRHAINYVPEYEEMEFLAMKL